MLKTIIKEEVAGEPRKVPGMSITLDPTKEFKTKSSRLWDACGLIPYFVVEALKEPTAKTVMDVMLDAYGWGSGHDMLGDDRKGKVDAEGIYSYPEDPPLHPICKFELEISGATVYVYQYGLVAVVGDDGKFMQRMD